MRIIGIDSMPTLRLAAGPRAPIQHMLDARSLHVAHILGEVKARGLRTVEASAEAEAAWVATILKYAQTRRNWLASCTPSNNEGQPDARIERNSQFWRGPMAAVRLLDE